MVAQSPVGVGAGALFGGHLAYFGILGDLALFFRCLRYNLRIVHVTDTAIVGPRTLATAGA
eukprot:COSAG05_NODE_310_length_11636_cov_115.006934_3_plen_61_part_00